MAAFISKRSQNLRLEQEYVCLQCKQFSTTQNSWSGHSRWSKIKHAKGAVDAKKNVQRSEFSKQIAFLSKMGGGDPNFNPSLANALLAAKKAGFPKASMEAAVARGQGRSATGAALESVTLEVIMPPTVAMVIDAETDSKNRTLMELRAAVKSHKGMVTPTVYLFKRKGRLQFEKDERNLGVDEVLDEAIEAGAEDVETDEDGKIVVWTEPNKVTAAAKALQTSFGLKVESSDILWDANEDTRVPLESSTSAKMLADFVAEIQENPTVQGVYSNATQGTLADEDWEDFASRLDA